MWKKICFIALAILPLFAFSQEEAPPEIPKLQSGIRFGYGLEFPSKNTIFASDFSLFEAGHRLNYGAFLNIRAEENVTFSPYFGFEHVFWPKSQNYIGGCEVDSFPTFHSVEDSLPGRDFRFWNFSFEPAFRFRSAKLGVWIKVQPYLTFSIRTRVENYSHTCGAPIARQWLVYEENDNRSMSRFNVGFGFGIVKEVKLNERSGFSIEPGFRAMLSALLDVESVDPNGPDFTLYPWGFYLNIGFFR